MRLEPALSWRSSHHNRSNVPEIECVNSRYRKEGARRADFGAGGRQCQRKYLRAPPLFGASPSTMAKDVNLGGKSNKYP
jgi:hypothetical protein